MFLLTVAIPLWLALASSSSASVIENFGGGICTVLANGHQRDDTPDIMDAFDRCGNGGIVVFPEDQNYWIATKLNPILNDAVIQWHGVWTVRMLTDDNFDHCN